MYAGIFIGSYAKNMAFKEHNSCTSMSQMELFRTKGTRFCGILQSSVILRLKLDDQILLLLIKPWWKLNEREVGKTEKYNVLKDEITRIWGMKEIIVIPVVVGALGARSTGFEKYIAAIGIEVREEHE